MTSSRRKTMAWVGTAILLALCLFPKAWMGARRETPTSAPHADKVVHLAMFLCYSILWMRTGMISRGRTAIILGSAVALAIGTELLQGLPFIARDPDPFDALADILGSFFGVALVIQAKEALGLTGGEPVEGGEGG